LPLIVSSPEQSKHGVRNERDGQLGRHHCRRYSIGAVLSAPQRRSRSPARSILPILEYAVRRNGVACSRRTASMRFSSTTRCGRCARASTVHRQPGLRRWSFRSRATSRLRRRGGDCRYGRQSVSAPARCEAFLHRPAGGAYDRADPTKCEPRRGSRAPRECSRRMRAEMKKFRATHTIRGCQGRPRFSDMRRTTLSDRFVAPATLAAPLPGRNTLPARGPFAAHCLSHGVCKNDDERVRSCCLIAVCSVCRPAHAGSGGLQRATPCERRASMPPAARWAAHRVRSRARAAGGRGAGSCALRIVSIRRLETAGGGALAFPPPRGATSPAK
jgi:hypothetical protein